MLRSLVLAWVVFGFSTAVLADEALIKAGQRAFAACRSCHVVDPDADSTLGPNLWAIAGAKAAQREDFAYSDVMQKSGVVWTDDALDKWLASPKTFMPGAKMAYVGMTKAEDRKALIAFLKSKK